MEIYIARFPTFTDKRQVSKDGGYEPHWRNDGKELFYLSPDDKVMSVDVRMTEELETGAPKILFQIQMQQGEYCVTGDRFRLIALHILSIAAFQLLLAGQTSGQGLQAGPNEPYVSDAPNGTQAPLDLRVSKPDSNSWLFPITQLNESLPAWLRFGGQFRNRVEGQVGYRFAPIDDFYDLTQLRVGIYIQPKSWFKIVGVTQDARAFFNHHVPNAPPYQNIWDLREGYVQFGSAESGWIDVSAGREILTFGDERVIGPSEWVNMGRTFDTVRLDLHSSAFKASVFAASVIVARDGVLDHHIEGNNLYGVYSSFLKLIPHATVEPYLLWRVAPDDVRLPENAGLGHLSEVTGGVRLAGYVGASDYDLEMNKQTGSLGSKTVDAWAGHWNTGYTFKRLHWKPRPFIEYNYASGNKNPNGQTWGTHDQLYPSAHDKMDFADQFGWRNIKDLRTGIEEKFGRKWTVMEVVDNVWLATRNDALYNSAGAISVAAHPNVTSTHVGTELEFVAEFKQNQHIRYGFGLAHLFTGQFLNEATKGKDYNYPFAYSTYVF
jgi:hypothetical protein